MTSEEETLLKKYDKLKRKITSLEKASQPEPSVKDADKIKPVEVRDAKQVIEDLKRTGQLTQIIQATTQRKTEFKRKIPLAKAKPGPKLDEPREVVSYEDDLFS